MRTYYALRHYRTGNLMPELGTGYSRWEGTPSHEHPPRLFAAEKDAKRARTFWIKGEATTEYSTDARGYGYSVGFEDVGRTEADLVIAEVGVVRADTIHSQEQLA